MSHPSSTARFPIALAALFLLATKIHAAPATPYDITATATSDTSIQVDWEPGSDDQDRFVVERDDGSGFIEVTDTIESYFTDRNLDPGASYDYRVYAYNTDSASNYSATATATTVGIHVVTPTYLSASAVSAHTVQLHWDDNSLEESGFVIERDAGSGFSQLTTVNGDQTSYTDTGLTQNTTYFYRIYAYEGSDTSDYSNTAWATTNVIVAPLAPTALSAIALSPSSIRFSWQQTSANTTGFVVQRTTGDTFQNVATVGFNNQSFTDTGLDSETTYYYRVYAYNEGGSSNFSQVISATTPQAPPDGAYGVTVVALNPHSARVKWNYSDDAETGFLVQRALSNGTFRTIFVADPSMRQFLDTGVTGGYRYSYRIIAVNEAGQSPASNTATVFVPYENLARMRGARNVTFDVRIVGGSAIVVGIASNGKLAFRNTPFLNYTGRLHVAAGDVNGDGVQDVVVATGPGGGSRIVALNGALPTTLLNFLGASSSYHGDLNLAVGDVNGDRRADIIVGSGAGARPVVQIFNGRNGHVLKSFRPYSIRTITGVFVGFTNSPTGPVIVTEAGHDRTWTINMYRGGNGVRLGSYTNTRQVSLNGIYPGHERH